MKVDNKNKIDVNFLIVEQKPLTIDFDMIYQKLVDADENKGIFVDNFSDNIALYIEEIYGVDVNQFEYRFDDIEAYNSNVCDLIFEKWQDYLDVKLKKDRQNDNRKDEKGS